MIRLRSILYVGMLAPLAALPAAAEPRASLLIQAQAPAPAAAPPLTREEERDRRRSERRERREERREDRQRAQTPAAPQAQQTLPPVNLPSVAAPAAQPAPQPPQAVTSERDRDRRPTRDENRRDDRRFGTPPIQAQTPPAAQPAPQPPQAATSERDRDRRRAREENRRDDRRFGTPPSQAQTPPPPPAVTQAAPTQAPPAPPAATQPAPVQPPFVDPSRRSDDLRRAQRRDGERRIETARDEWRNRRLDDVREQRRQTREDGRTVIREPGRTIIREGGRTIIRHDDSDRFRARAQDIRTERRGGDTITTVVRPDGTRIVTVMDSRDRLVRRTRIDRFGREVVLIDSRPRPYFGPPPVVVLPPPRIMIPRERYIVEAAEVPPPVIIETLEAPPVDMIERPYTLDEIVHSVQVRDRMPRVDLDSITFATGSWAIDPLQAQKLAGIAEAMKNIIARNPAEMFLVEGHTDAVGSDIDNLSLSDRRAESVAIVLTEEFGVPPENLQTQGYGEEFLKVPTSGASRENRRVAIRRITPLLSGTAQAVR